MQHRRPLTKDYLITILRYDPDTGNFWWKENRNNKQHLNGPAGSMTSSRGTHRISICIDKKKYLAHRLAWFYITGEWPSDEIDHIDGNGLNNRWNNLREADRYLNNQNLRKCKKHNGSGLLGAWRCNDRDKWESSIRVNGKHIHLGRFSTAWDAHQAYLKAKRKMHQGNTL